MKEKCILFIASVFMITLLTNCAEHHQAKTIKQPSSSTSDNAFESNDPEYLYNLGEGYLKDGNHATEAVYCFRKAAALGHTGAQGAYGTMLVASQLPQNYPEAFKWLSMAAEKGDINGMTNLGMMYHHGVGVNKDISKAIEWYKKSAIKGRSSAQYKLGMIYLNGDGVSKDLNEANNWFKMAA